jgi:predicted HicB family RNase H-like nuclease
MRDVWLKGRTIVSSDIFIYKSFVGAPWIDVEENVIRGKIVNTRDTTTFFGKTVDEAAQAFRDSVDDYLEFCAELSLDGAGGLPSSAS